MNRVWIVACFMIFLLLVACQQAEPTPREPSQVARLPEVSVQAIETTMLTLLRNPAAFEGQLIRLTGDYKPLPIAICRAEVRRSPASWSLVDGEAETLAAGFDSMLRGLAQPGITMVVEGQWQQWQGPVGCGRRAPESQIWYLDVTNIISPNPLVAITPEPQLVAEATATNATIQAPGESIDQDGAEAGEEEFANPTVTLTRPTVTPLSTADISLSATPSPSVTATSPTPDTTTSTITPSVTGTPPTATATSEATGTSQAGTPTATATGGAAATVSPTPLPTARSQQFLDFDDIVVEQITAGTAKSWRFFASIGEIITISAGPVPGLDISLELIDPNGQILQTKNQAGNGIAETIADVQLVVDGDYQLIVRSVTGTGQYSLVLLTSDSLPFMVHRGTMSYGQNNTASVPEDVDHLWHFEGTSGDVVTIRAEANGPEDIVLYLTGPNGVELDFVDEDINQGPPNDFEEITQFTLPMTGLYVIGVGESDFLAFSYTLSLNN